MTTHLTPSPLLQFSVNGQPASGYQLFTYVAGTTTKTVTYKDSVGTSNTNPIILDSNGTCQIWLTDGKSYKYFLATPTDSDPPTGTNFFPVDNISSPAGAMTALSINSITTNTALSAGVNNTLVLANATGGAIAATLPSAITAGSGFIITLKKTDSSANAVTVATVLSQTIDASSTYVLPGQWDVVQLVSDGANWQTVITADSSNAPAAATYITQTPNSMLANEQALSALSSGIMHSATATGVVTTVSDSATAGTLLQSGGAGVTPSYTTATYPTTTTVNQLLYSSSSNTIGGLATANSSVLSTSAGGVPSWSATLPNVNIGTPTAGVLTNCTGLPTSSLTGQVALANGGTNANLTASNGGIFYSTGTAGAILAGTATASKILLSGSSSAPTWSTSTIPTSSGAAGKILRSDGTNYATTTATFADTYAASTLLYSNGANTVTGLATANSAQLVTTSTGVPAWSGTMTNGQVIIGSTGTTPVAGTITGSNGVTIATGAGTLAIAGTTWVRISTSTPSAVASVNIAGLTNSYRAFLFVLSSVIPATNAVGLQMEVLSDATGANYGWAGTLATGAASPATTAVGSVTTIPTLSGNNTVANSANRGVNGTVWLYNPNSTSNAPQCHCTWNTAFLSSTASTMAFCTGGFLNGNSVSVTSVTFLFSSGNITSGTIELWGLLV